MGGGARAQGTPGDPAVVETQGGLGTLVSAVVERQGGLGTLVDDSARVDLRTRLGGEQAEQPSPELAVIEAEEEAEEEEEEDGDKEAHPEDEHVLIPADILL